MAKVGLTALITSCSGVLIGLLAYAGQNTSFSGVERYHAGWSAALAGIGLWVAIAAAFVSYLNTGFYWAGMPKARLWWATIGLFLGSLILLGAALVHAALLVIA